MVAVLTRNWWMLALQGLAAVILGIFVLVWPFPALLSLVIFLGALALVDGIFALTEGIVARWWPAALAGGAGIIVGVLTFVWPTMTGLVLLYLIAAWALLTGMLEIVAAIELRRTIRGEWLMILGGLLSIVLSVLLVLFPGAGALGVAWLIGAYALVSGILLVVLAFRVRSWSKQVDKAIERTVADLA